MTTPDNLAARASLLDTILNHLDRAATFADVGRTEEAALRVELAASYADQHESLESVSAALEPIAYDLDRGPDVVATIASRLDVVRDRVRSKRDALTAPGPDAEWKRRQDPLYLPDESRFNDDPRVDRRSW
jgi:hypothetical protein